MGGRRARPRDPRGRPADHRRGDRDRAARRAAPGVPRRPVRPLGRPPRSTGAGCSTSSGPGQPIRERPDRYRESIERLTVQDIAVFFQEVLAALPQLVADLSRGGRVVDIHCGGGRWLIAMARRFPALELVGVEFEPDSVDARPGATSRPPGLTDRIAIRKGDVSQPGPAGEYDLAYFQYALHQLDDPVGGPAGRLGGTAPRRPDHRPRLAAAVLDRGVPDAPRRADRRRPARRALPGHRARDPRAPPRVVRGGRAAGAAAHRPAVRRLVLRWSERPADRPRRDRRRALPGDGDRALHLRMDRAVERVRARGAEHQRRPVAPALMFGVVHDAVVERGGVRGGAGVGERDDLADRRRDGRPDRTRSP